MFSRPYNDSKSNKVNLCKHLSCPSAFDHVCWVYENNEEHRTVLVEFVKEGLRNNEKVVIVYGSIMMKAQILGRVQLSGESTDKKIRLFVRRQHQPSSSPCDQTIAVASI